VSGADGIRRAGSVPGPRGYHRVQRRNDYILVAITTGIIMQLLLNH